MSNKRKNALCLANVLFRDVIKFCFQIIYFRFFLKFQIKNSEKDEDKKLFEFMGTHHQY